MTPATLRGLILLGAMIGVSAPGYAELTQDAASPAAAAPSVTAAPTATPAPVAAPAKAATQTSTLAAAPDVPPADVLKKARRAGYHTRIKNGEVLYCKTDAQLGTRITQENCLNQNMLVLTLERVQLQRDQMLSNHGCTTSPGNPCSVR